jgi:prepilin-type N-terminal cleavage/methylation domain-containing protein
LARKDSKANNEPRGENKKMKRNQSGFTLIEIAIVLVIIGLLLGGVLKGQELINSARVKNLATDFKNIPVFIYGYQDKFRALPGDDRAVDTHLASLNPGCAGGTCPIAAGTVLTAGNGVINGAWNSSTTSDESYLFWQHIRLAGLAPGNTTLGAADYNPVNASGGIIGIQSGTDVVANSPVSSGGVAIRGSYVICSSGILGKFVKQLDLQMDDSNTAGGSMMATPVSGYAVGTATATATAAINDSDSYIVCMGV